MRHQLLWTTRAGQVEATDAPLVVHARARRAAYRDEPGGALAGRVSLARRRLDGCLLLDKVWVDDRPVVRLDRSQELSAFDGREKHGEDWHLLTAHTKPNHAVHLLDVEFFGQNGVLRTATGL